MKRVLVIAVLSSALAQPAFASSQTLCDEACTAKILNVINWATREAANSLVGWLNQDEAQIERERMLRSIGAGSSDYDTEVNRYRDTWRSLTPPLYCNECREY